MGCESFEEGSEAHDLWWGRFVAENMSVEVSAKCTPLWNTLDCYITPAFSYLICLDFSSTISTPPFNIQYCHR